MAYLATGGENKIQVECRWLCREFCVDSGFLFHRKLRPMKQKTLREDAHSREAETCRKRPRSARECVR